VEDAFLPSPLELVEIEPVFEGPQQQSLVELIAADFVLQPRGVRFFLQNPGDGSAWM
jgi:hypothetical protein